MKKYHLFGRDIELEMTVAAFAEISDLCPDGDISSIDKMLGAPSGQRARFTAQCIAALSRGAEGQKAYDDPAYKPHPLVPACAGVILSGGTKIISGTSLSPRVRG